MFRLIFRNYSCLLIVLSSLSVNNAKNIDNARLFGYTYTSTVVESKVVTSIVPSSCVQVEPTLPPCRSVRFLRFPKLPSITFNHLSNQKIVTNVSDSELKSTALGWGEYFGLYAPTVTVTRTDLHVTTVEDPAVVVTFAVRGCRPVKLPLDLNRCSPEDVFETSSVSINTVSVMPTKTVVINPSSTVYEAMTGIPEAPHFQDNSNLLESSAQEQVENEPPRATESLRRL